MSEERGVILPPGVSVPTTGRLDSDPGRTVIDNRTGLPDEAVRAAVEAHFVENASMIGANLGSMTFQTYANDGANFLTRARYQVPTSVFEEIKLARELADKDDDVRSTIGQMVAVAFGEGMENFHDDDQTVQMFNEVAKNANLDTALKSLYREYLIAGSLTTVQLFTVEQFDYSPTGTGRSLPRKVIAPLLGKLEAEHVRVLGNDVFGTGQLAYLPPEQRLRDWLMEYFDPETSPARKAEMGRQDRVSAAMFTQQLPITPQMMIELGVVDGSNYIYLLNPRMCARLKMPSDGKYPRPLLTANFALLEAKRLLNIMDYALLQGGANYIVVAKQGSDQRPAQQPEIDALSDTVRRASRTGVIVGDHRLQFEIITPKMDGLLSPEKRRLIGRKLSQLLLRLPDAFEATESGAVVAQIELLSRTITSDRHDIKRHIEAATYGEVVKRNRDLLKQGAAKLWFPKVVLQGTNYFTDLVLKLRDRGDIPRKWAVEAGGFDYEAALAERKRELARGDDDVLKPAAVPFNSPQNGPSDNPDGRPPGSSPDNGAPGARPGQGQDPAAPRRQSRGPGEPVRAWWDDEEQTTFRVGEMTYGILEEYPEHSEGRITQRERETLDAREPTIDGPLAIVPVNVDEELGQYRAVNLTSGLRLILGYRKRDEALMARALVFRQPEFDPLAAEEHAIVWGFPVGRWSQTVEVEPEVEEERAQLEPGENPQRSSHVINLHVETRSGKVRKTLRYDDDGNLIGSDEEPEDD